MYVVIIAFDLIPACRIGELQILWLTKAHLGLGLLCSQPVQFPLSSFSCIAHPFARILQGLKGSLQRIDLIVSGLPWP